MSNYADLIKSLNGHADCMDIDAWTKCKEAAEAIEAQAKEIIGLDSQLRDSHEMTCHQDARIAELETENVKLREALVKLNAAVDAFWNDPDRPSIAKMKSNSVYDVNEAQFRARAALGESDGNN